MIHDEEETGREATPRKDLASAVLIGALAGLIMLGSTRLEVPDRLYTAPGLMPFVIALALLAMAAALGWRAVRAGAARRIGACVAAAWRTSRASAEDRRAALLSGVVLAYVALVAAIHFELKIATDRFDIVVSGYELISVAVVTIVLRAFWRARLWRCLLVAAIAVELLAAAFRYGFHLIMPEAF